MKHVIAFTGRARSGKNTSADMWQDLNRENGLGEREGKLTLEFAFATILKDIAQRSLGINPHDAEELKSIPTATVANGLTIREFYNSLGDSIKSYFGMDAWVKITTERLKDLNDSLSLYNIILTDLRYPIEQQGLIDFSEENGYKLTVIKLRNLNQSQRDDNREHESEYLVDLIKEDFLIEAKSTEEIKEQLRIIYHQVVDVDEEKEHTIKENNE